MEHSFILTEFSNNFRSLQHSFHGLLVQIDVRGGVGGHNEERGRSVVANYLVYLANLVHLLLPVLEELHALLQAAQILQAALARLLLRLRQTSTCNFERLRHTLKKKKTRFESVDEQKK